MKKLLILLSFSLFLICGCEAEKKNGEKKNYLRWVGDIQQEHEIDPPNFHVCNGDENILQYFNLGEGPKYIGEKSAVENTFKKKYKSLTDNSQNGFIRIRFIVNCAGKAGRFRVLQSNYNYKEIKFDKKIVSQLLEITQTIKNWEILYKNEAPVDYYFYLIFKIKNGQLIEILP